MMKKKKMMMLMMIMMTTLARRASVRHTATSVDRDVTWYSSLQRQCHKLGRGLVRGLGQWVCIWTKKGDNLPCYM